jgi:hypothetical protein
VKARYAIVRRAPNGDLTIKDLGPWDTYATITNDAEEVVRDLLASGQLMRGERLFYYDSEGWLDELLIVNGVFAGFAPGLPDGGLARQLRAAARRERA